MNVDGLGFVIPQYPNQSSRIDILFEQAVRHLTQTCTGRGGEYHHFVVANLVRHRRREAYGFRALTHTP